MVKRLVKKLKKGEHLSNSDPETKAKFLKFQREIALADRALKEAAGARKRVLRAAKVAGLNVQQIVAVLKAREKDPDVLAAQHNTFIRYCAWANLPIGTQTEMFGEGNLAGDDNLTDAERREHVMFEANDSGYRAGRSGQDRTSSNPFPPGSETHVAFDTGYLRGQEAIAAEMDPKVTKLVGRRGRKAGNPEDAPQPQEATA